MASAFQCIGLIGKQGDARVTATLAILEKHLLERGCRVVQDECTATSLQTNAAETCDRNRLGRECQLVIVVGGDGTILRNNFV